MNTPRPLVGIVTPVYNGEPYLVECIESVRRQTYDDWEYTIVNNCSKDRSLEIARDYAATDPRIRVHDNAEFVSQTRNFNIAFGQVSPQAAYYKMVQADDWIFPECLERMVDLAEANPRVGIVSSYQLQGAEVAATGLPFPSTVVNGRDLCRRQLLQGLFVFGSATAVLYRADAVRRRNPFYDEAMLHQDTDAAYRILREWDFGFVHQVLTYYRTDNEGISSATRSLSPHFLDKFIVILKHGRGFLSEGEYAEFLAKFRRRYFRVLGRGLFFRNGWRQYQYHREVLKGFGFDLTLGQIAPHALYEMLDLILNPKHTIGEIVRALRAPRSN